MNRNFDSLNLNVLVSNQIYPEVRTDVSLDDSFLLGSSCDLSIGTFGTIESHGVGVFRRTLSIGTIESTSLEVFRHNGTPAQEENGAYCLDHASEIPLRVCAVESESSLASVTTDEEDALMVLTSLSSIPNSTSTSSTKCLTNPSNVVSGEQRTLQELSIGTIESPTGVFRRNLTIGTIESPILGVFRHNGSPAQEENRTDCLDLTNEIPLSFCTFESSLASVTADEDDRLETSLSSYSTSTSASSTQCLMKYSQDESDEQRTLQEHVGTCDVLLGRGPQYYQHSGNVHFHNAKLLIQEQYLQASKLEKQALSQRLVDTVHSLGGNFLKKDAGKWIIVSSETARRKASQALRETFTPERRREKRLKYQKKTKKST